MYGPALLWFCVLVIACGLTGAVATSTSTTMLAGSGRRSRMKGSLCLSCWIRTQKPSPGGLSRLSISRKARPISPCCEGAHDHVTHTAEPSEAIACLSSVSTSA